MRSENARVGILENEIRHIIGGKLLLDAGAIPDDSTLSELGFDSLGLSDLAEAFVEYFNVKMPDRMVPGTLTVNGLVDLIAAMRMPHGDVQAKWNSVEAAD